VGKIFTIPNTSYIILIYFIVLTLSMSNDSTEEKIKDKVMGAKDKVKETIGMGGGNESERKDDPLKEYRDKEPMTPAKEREHEPTAVKREMTERITEPGQTGTNPEEAREIARSKGMAKGTAGAAETGDQYEQGAAGSNK
jgi:hypothetical protein